ncbi:hypothetical protein ADK38_04940, partial [Streptomyces varsoviensis]
LGATHTVELPFVFGFGSGGGSGLDASPLRGERALLGPDAPPADLTDLTDLSDLADLSDLSERMHAAWVRFARTGDPGWAPYDTERRATMVIGRDWEVRDDPRAAVRRAWQRR